LSLGSFAFALLRDVISKIGFGFFIFYTAPSLVDLSAPTIFDSGFASTRIEASAQELAVAN
jgi:hypothetical protein